jgi:hypothetical protein
MKRAKALDPTENPTAAEAADVVAIMESVYSSMKERGRIFWTLTEIPTAYQDPFISIVAKRIAPDFGLLTPELLTLAAEAEREIDALNERRVDVRSSPVVDY